MWGVMVMQGWGTLWGQWTPAERPRVVSSLGGVRAIVRGPLIRNAKSQGWGLSAP